MRIGCRCAHGRGCITNQRPACPWFVLQEILGKNNVKNYDGSWVEYGSLVGAPIELGA